MPEKEPLKTFFDNYVFGQKYGSNSKAGPRLRYWPILAITSFVIVTFGVYLVIKDNRSQTISQNYEKSPAELSADENYMIETAPISKDIEKTGYDSSLSSSTTLATQTKGLMVTGIICSEGSPSAVVGNQLVHEGDEVSGATVVKINRESVEFERNNIRWTQAVREPPASHWE